MINSNVTTITLGGNETAVEFSKGYPYFQITNKGDSDIFVSVRPNISPEADGTYTIAAGETARIGEGYGFNTFYILGTGKAYIRGELTAFPTSFKQGGKGGDSGGGSEYTLPVASVNALGGVKSGGDISVSSAGAVTVNSVGGKTVKADVPADAKFTDTVYTLPTASTDTLGGVKIDGTSITMDENGTISAAGGSSSLEIGGRNYIRNGNFADGLNFWGTNGYGNVELFPELDYTGHEHNLVKIDLAGKTRSTSIYQDIYLPISGLKNQRTAVISFYARRGNNDGKVSELGLHFNSGNSTYFDVPYADNYKSNRYSFSFPTQDLDNYNGPVLGGNESKGGRTTLYLTLYGDDSSKNGIIYISDIQLEFADDGVISDYRPAPEDLKYTLPAATADVLGGVKVDGTTITVTDDGTISASESINETQKLAVQIAHPNNYLIYDDMDKPSTMVAFPKFYLDEVIDGAEHIVHPAFMVNGVEQNAIYISKYQNIVENNRAYSLPMKDPAVKINFDQSWSYCKNKGTGWHLMTNAEWAAIALWCKKNGTMPKGNNNFGKDISETNLPQKAIAASVGSDGKINRVLTGSGRESWYHDGTYAGIADLNGNIWEWVGDIRSVYGELQVIPYNNAASGEHDISASSSDWKAINAIATSWDDLFIVPDGSGTTANSVKLDYVSNHWQWSATITSQTNTVRAAFSVTTSANIDAIAKQYLQAMALLPEDGATTDSYGGDYFTANNGEAERCMIRGGNWDNGAIAGIFRLNFIDPRSNSNGAIGGRSAYVNTTAQPLAATSVEALDIADITENEE